MFREDAVFAEGAVEGAAKAGTEGLRVERAREVALVEEGDYFVWGVLDMGVVVEWVGRRTTGLEACDMLAD